MSQKNRVLRLVVKQKEEGFYSQIEQYVLKDNKYVHTQTKGSLDSSPGTDINETIAEFRKRVQEVKPKYVLLKFYGDSPELKEEFEGRLEGIITEPEEPLPGIRDYRYRKI